MKLTIEVFKQDSNFVAKCRELDIYSYGRTSENAVKRLKDVISFYIQSVGEYIDEDANEIKNRSNIENEYIN